MSDRAHLLSLLIDDEVLAVLKQRLTPEQRADLVLEIINPHRPLSSEQKGALAGVSASAIRKRKTSKTTTH